VRGSQRPLSLTLCIEAMSDINTDSEILPLELVDKAIGSQVRILLINDREFEGTLVGFDEFVNVILSDVTETGPEGTIHRDEMLLTGTTIAMFVTV